MDGSAVDVFFVANELSLSGADLLALDQKRWSVEVYHKSLKQNAALGDEGYFALAEMAELQSGSIEAVFADRLSGRRRKDLPPTDVAVLVRAQAAVGSEEGKAFLRKRGQHVERAFCHLLDHGGLRRATLRGLTNLSKRYLMGAMSFHLSLRLGEQC